MAIIYLFFSSKNHNNIVLFSLFLQSHIYVLVCGVLETCKVGWVYVTYSDEKMQSFFQVKSLANFTLRCTYKLVDSA